ncbi:hypothetical protein LINGRAHAP2_LOCUS12451, partial [Linum grandiflorum]
FGSIFVARASQRSVRRCSSRDGWLLDRANQITLEFLWDDANVCLDVYYITMIDGFGQVKPVQRIRSGQSGK